MMRTGRVKATDLVHIVSASLLAIMSTLILDASPVAATDGFDVVTVPNHVMTVTNASPGDYVEASVTLNNNTDQVLDAYAVLLMTGNLLEAAGAIQANFYSCDQPYSSGAEQYRFNCPGSQTLIKTATAGQAINQVWIRSGIPVGSTLWFKVRLTLLGGNEIQNRSGVATIRFIAEGQSGTAEPSPTTPSSPHQEKPITPNRDDNDELPTTGAQIDQWLVLGSCFVVGGTILVLAGTRPKGKHHA